MNGEAQKISTALESPEILELNNQWLYWARPGKQLPPEGIEFRNWLVLGGRGAGKTRAGIVDQFGILCSTAVASAQGKLVCYASDADGRPTTLMFETTVLDFATVGFKTLTQVQSFQRGALYWLGLRHSSTATINAHQPYCSPALSLPTPPTTAANKLLRRTLAFATAAPATWGWTATEEASANVPAIFMELV